MITKEEIGLPATNGRSAVFYSIDLNIRALMRREYVSCVHLLRAKEETLWLTKLARSSHEAPHVRRETRRFKTGESRASSSSRSQHLFRRAVTLDFRLLTSGFPHKPVLAPLFRAHAVMHKKQSCRIVFLFHRR
jgi:hypothetical protein